MEQRAHLVHPAGGDNIMDVDKVPENEGDKATQMEKTPDGESTPQNRNGMAIQMKQTADGPQLEILMYSEI